MPLGRITLVGGSGFVGSHLAARLAERAKEVIILTRHAHRVRKLRVLHNVQVREVKVHDQDALSAALQGSDVVVNLVGVLNDEGGNASFSAAHVKLTAKVIAACREAHVPRYLHMSSLNAGQQVGDSEYLRSKGEAEALVRECDRSIAWTMFRPSVIFGEGDSFFNRFASLTRLAPVFPLGMGYARLQPVYVGDVCERMIASIDDASTYSQAIELCGPEVFTLRELVEYTCRTTNTNCRVIDLPDWAARAQARVLQLLPGTPLSIDNLESLKTDSVCSGDCTLQATSIDSVVPRYLGSQDWAGRLQKRRTLARR